MKRKITMFIAAAASLAIASLGAGCAASTSGGSYSSAPYGSAANASDPNGGVGAAKVGAAGSPFGRIVVDDHGRSLYLFERDKDSRSACSGRCAAYWPPLLTHGKAMARRGAKQSLLGTTRRADGREQVTYAGHPVYRFLEDRKAGQTKGEGSHAFGAGWDLLAPTGRKIESD